MSTDTDQHGQAIHAAIPEPDDRSSHYESLALAAVRGWLRGIRPAAKAEISDYDERGLVNWIIDACHDAAQDARTP